MSTNTDRWALITGCSEGGIGDALARAFLAKGIKVIATARNVAKISASLAASPGVEVLPLDVTDQASIDAAVEKVHALTSSKLHYLINNAGISYYTPLLDLSPTHLSTLFATNITSLVNLTQAFFPLLHPAHGTIVNNGSSGGVDTAYLPFSGAYNASKSAAAKLSHTMRLELAPFGVKVVTLYAGGVETKLWDNLAGAGHAKLKAGSLYQPIKAEAENIMSGAFIENSPLQPWAEGVVREILKRDPPREVWSGKLAGTVWWMNFLAPRWLVDWAFSAQTALSLLKGRLEGERKEV